MIHLEQIQIQQSEQILLKKNYLILTVVQIQNTITGTKSGRGGV